MPCGATTLAKHVVEVTKNGLVDGSGSNPGGGFGNPGSGFGNPGGGHETHGGGDGFEGPGGQLSIIDT
ncbi:hypothetical protein Tco_0958926 [Tanacetum coccineum]